MKTGMSTLLLIAALSPHPAFSAGSGATVTILPEPALSGDLSLEEILQARRSVRCFDPGAALDLGEVSQILWSAQGITGGNRLRTAPSAGALHPFTVYLVAERVDSLDPGVYRYSPQEGELILLEAGSRLAELSEAAFRQRWMNQACILLVLAADCSVVTDVYGERGVMYTHMEAGHISQNVYLQCVSLGLGTCAVGAFDEPGVADLLPLEEGEVPLYLMPVGFPD